LLIGSIAFAIISIGLNLLYPTDTTAYNVVLTIVLIVVGVISLWMIARDESLAVQLFWWSVLAIIGGMVALDDHRVGTLPIVLYVPPVAAVAVRLLSGFKAAFAYCAGVFALMVPAGVAYDSLDRTVILAGVVALWITVDWIREAKRRNQQTR